MGLQEVAGCYNGLQRVPWGYKVTGGYRGLDRLQGVTKGYNRLQRLQGFRERYRR